MSGENAIQVVITDALRESFESWLDARGLTLFRMPLDGDLDTYGVGIK